MSEQVKTAVPDAGKPAPPGEKNRKGLLVGIVGGLLTAGAVVLALNGGTTFIKKDATLSLVAPTEITDASRTLDPASSGSVGKPREGMLGTARSGGDLEDPGCLWWSY